MTTSAIPFDAAALRDALDRIERWHATHHPETVEALRPGLTEAAIDRQLQVLPFRLPREIRALYGWHDGAGLEETQFIWYHYFMSLDRAIATYRSLSRGGLFARDEFPILELDGEYFVVRGAEQLEDTSPVWHVHEAPERPINFISFTAFMQTAADWFDADAVFADDGGALMERDVRTLRAIHQRHNPGATFPYAIG